MTRLVPVGLAALLVASVLLLAHQLWPARPEPDAEVQRQRAADSAFVAATKAENDRLLAAVGSANQALQDSAAAHAKAQAGYLASANAKNRRIAALLASDSARADSLRQAAAGSSVPVAPGILAVDPASSCEERYALRTGEALDLRQALTECDRKAAADSTRAELVHDSLSTANGRLLIALERSDSARRAEIARPRPCTRDLVLAHPPCHVVDLVIAGVTFTGGVLVGRGSRH